MCGHCQKKDYCYGPLLPRRGAKADLGESAEGEHRDWETWRECLPENPTVPPNQQLQDKLQLNKEIYLEVL